MTRRTRRSRSRRTTEKQAPVLLARRPHARDAARSGRGRLSRNHSSRRLNAGQLGRASSGSSVSTAKSGIRPTIERTCSGICSPVGQVEHVVEEAVLVVPEPDAVVADVVIAWRCGGSARRTCVATSSYAGSSQASSSAMREHVQAVHRHPARAVGLLEVAAGRQRRAAVEDADVVEAEEAALEDVVALRVLAVHPPGEVEQQLVEDALEERRGRRGRVRCLLDLVDAPARPRRGPAGSRRRTPTRRPGAGRSGACTTRAAAG